MTAPTQPKIYHITHIDNLSSIIADGLIWSDALMAQRHAVNVIGMAGIKGRRLQLPVSCHPGTAVGDYVPFYFCPRSIMLYVIFKANHPELAYRGGQEPIVHLQADLHAVVGWADADERPWAFSLSNAGAVYAQFRASLDALDEVNWAAVNAADFRSAEIKEGKQAEFLVHDSFPWQLVERIGVRTRSVAHKAAGAMAAAGHRPLLEIQRDWYY